MFVRAQYDVSGVPLDGAVQSVKLMCGGDLQAKVTLSRLKTPSNHEGQAYTAAAIATGQFEPSRKVAAELHGLGSGAPSANAQQTLAKVHSDLVALLSRTVRVMMWRGGLGERLHRFLFRGGQWSLERRAWHSIPGLLHFQFDVTVEPKEPFTPAALRDVRKLVRADLDEPLGRQLLREAWELKDRSSRAALVLGVTAVEVGIKQYLGKRLPDTSWLLDNIPFPPVHMMLEEHLPWLPLRIWFLNKSRQFPKELVHEIRTGVTLRNKVVHTGAAHFTRDKLDRVLRAVSDVLWILDLLDGKTWAAKNIRHGTISAWASVSPKPPGGP